MKKVLVIGCGGSGKSTLARRIGVLTGLPVVHLDTFYWQSGWVATDDANWKQAVNDILQKPAWIIDGNYGGTMSQRIAASDTVLFLDFPTIVCLWRIVKRRIVYAGKSRPDMAEGCSEHLTWEFVRYVMAYRATRRPRVRKLLESVKTTKRIVVLDRQAAVNEFVSSLSKRV